MHLKTKVMKLNYIIAFLLINSALFSQKIVDTFDIITFEKPCSYLELDTSANNVWQIGKPRKKVFNSAYTPFNAIITDTINHYPASNYSYFDIKIGNFNMESYDYNVFIGIKHKYDTDRFRDGGYITVSHDGGQTWLNIVNDTFYNMHCWLLKPGFGSRDNDFSNLYTENDTLCNGEYGYSGSSDGWINTWFSWHCIPVTRKEDNDNINRRLFEEDTMILRFNFISDSTDSGKDGWMIDDILLFAGDIGSGVDDQIIQNFKIFPNPVTNDISLSFDKYQNDIDITICGINGDEIIRKHHQSGQVISFEIKGLADGIYIIKTYSKNKIVSIGKFVVK